MAAERPAPHSVPTLLRECRGVCASRLLFQAGLTPVVVPLFSSPCTNDCLARIDDPTMFASLPKACEVCGRHRLNLNRVNWDRHLQSCRSRSPSPLPSPSPSPSPLRSITSFFSRVETGKCSAVNGRIALRGVVSWSTRTHGRYNG